MISINDWRPSDGIVMEPSALSAIQDLKNSLVSAGPGAGKTELLAQKVSFLFETNSCVNPSKILAISFKKDAAVNLKDRVKKRISSHLETRFVSQTYDSFSKSILDRFLYALPEEYRPVKDYEIASNDNELVKAFAECEIRLSSKRLKNIYISNLTNTKLPLNDELYDAVWRKLLKGNENIKPTLSFSMITLLAIYILETNPLILKSLRTTYSHIFLDEFQDTTHLQYELIKSCFADTPASITAVGDSRQRIMLWAGAKRNVFECYKNDFDSTEYTLNMNHRSAPRLLEIQKIVNNYLQDEPLVPIPNPKWSADEGSAEIWYFTDSTIEAENIAIQINDLVSKYEVPHREICIIVKQRVNQYSEELIQTLERFNIQARDETKFQDLLKEDIVLLIVNTLKSSLNPRNSDAWMHIWSAKIYFEGKNGTNNHVIFDSLRKQIKAFLKDIRNRLNIISDKEELNVLLYDILAFYDFNKIKKIYPQYSQGYYMDKLREDLNEYLYMYFEKTKDWLVALDSFEGINSVPVMTIHKSKGLEFETVFFVGFDDAAFWSFTSQEDEDTCTFFVGLSRSKRNLYFTFSENRFGKTCENSGISILYQMLQESGVVEEKYF